MSALDLLLAEEVLRARRAHLRGLESRHVELTDAQALADEDGDFGLGNDLFDRAEDLMRSIEAQRVLVDMARSRITRLRREARREHASVS